MLSPPGICQNMLNTLIIEAISRNNALTLPKKNTKRDIFFLESFVKLKMEMDQAIAPTLRMIDNMLSESPIK